MLREVSGANGSVACESSSNCLLAMLEKALAIELRTASLEEVRKHESVIGANLCIGGYHMDSVCPTDDIRFFHGLLDTNDTSRVFVLPDFQVHTAQNSCRIADALPTAESVALERQAAGASNSLDLTTREHLELMLVGACLEDLPLIVIDGNHRALAHYMRFGNLDRVPVFIGIHRAMFAWAHVPHLARQGAVKG